jgi:pyrroline-5-carboxylate reductase
MTDFFKGYGIVSCGILNVSPREGKKDKRQSTFAKATVDKESKDKSGSIAYNGIKLKMVFHQSDNIMKTKSIGFIGGGRVTKILLQGFKNKNTVFGKVVVAETNPEVLANLKKHFPEVEGADAKSAAGQDIVFISLHPPVVMDTLELIKADVNADAVVISLAPKINIAKISSKLCRVGNIARLIPNATSYINEGYNPVTFSGSFEKAEKKDILDMLSLLGTTFEVAEEKLEGYAILSAMLPTYFWFQCKELAEIGQKIGLNEKESMNSIHETLISSLSLMYKSGLTPDEIIDLIPVKPIGEHEQLIAEIYRTKLIGLFEKIKP